MRFGHSDNAKRWIARVAEFMEAEVHCRTVARLELGKYSAPSGTARAGA